MEMLQHFRMDDEIAIVTGGGTGIGRAIALALAGAGAVVVITGRRREPLQKTAAENPSHIIPMEFDVTDMEGAEDFARAVEKEVGDPAILVNNAGNHLKKPGGEVTVDEFRNVLDTHLLGAHALTCAVLPGMRARRHGVILYTASMASLFGIPNVLAYSAAKTAMLGVVRTMAVEYGGEGIRVNAIAPGWIDSDMTRNATQRDPARMERIIQRTPLGRFGDAEDVGLAALYLASPAGKFINGVCLPVDGGVSIGF